MDAECALESTTKAAQPVERAGAQEDQFLTSVVFEVERAGGVGLPYLSYDGLMEMGMAGDAGDGRAEKLQLKLKLSLIHI